MKITVHGVGCRNCNLLYEKIKKLVFENGINAEADYNSDSDKMVAKGVIAIPSLEIDGKVVCSGGVPSDKKFMKLLRV